jgi:hypothetical protein
MEGARVFCKMHPRSHSCVLGLLIAGAALAVPVGARAATVGESPGILTYAAAPGEANHVAITHWGLALKVTDTGTKAGKPIAIATAPGCWKLSASAAACSGNVSTLMAGLGDGDDFFDASGTGIAAFVTCGAGNDSGSATSLDSLGTDCEFRPGAASPAQATVPAQTVAISASGVARVQVVCPAGSGGCAGTVAIELPTSKATAASHARTSITVGKAKFTAQAGTAPIVPVRLSKRGRERIMRSRHRRGRIRVTTRSAGGRTTVTTQDVTFSSGRKSNRGRGSK